MVIYSVGSKKLSNVNPTLYSADTTILNQLFVSDIIIS